MRRNAVVDPCQDDLLVFICSSVKVACEPVSIMGCFTESEVCKYSLKARRRNGFPTTEKGNYCFPRPLVTNSNFITWLMQQDSDFTRTGFSDWRAHSSASCLCFSSYYQCLPRGGEKMTSLAVSCPRDIVLPAQCWQDRMHRLVGGVTHVLI